MYDCISACECACVYVWVCVCVCVCVRMMIHVCDYIDECAYVDV